MKCPNCQTENPEIKKVCRKCGTKLSLLCPQCGSEYPHEDEFCGNHSGSIILEKENTSLCLLNSGNGHGC
jgi:hypothetical protein